MNSTEVDEIDTLPHAVAASSSVAIQGRRLLGERFRLLRRLGEGGFGVVYEAEDLRDRGRVALKLLRNAGADWLYRFKREFRSLQGIAHPSLVVLDELFCEQESWFFTMELVDGRSFVEAMGVAPPGAEIGVAFDAVGATEPAADAPRWEAASSATSAHVAFDEQRLRHCLRSLFDVLSVLHAANKVHRDIKPANVLVTREGRVVLIDFGLVTDSFNGNASAAVGTPAYMAPEQAASQDVGPAADLYAAGVMLHEVLTGRLPVVGPPLQMLIDKQTYNPTQARLPLDLPEDLRALCVKLLHVEPSKRPSAAEAWRALAEGGESTSPPERSSTGSPLFVGRVAELEALRRAFVASTHGQLVVVLVSGESGIGKSHLVRRFAKRLLAERPEVMVLEGRCHEREAVPYKTLDGVVDALSRRLSSMPASEVAALLPTQRAMLTRIFPVMLRVPQLAREFAKAEGGDPQSTRQRAFSALRDLFSRIALDRPTVIAVDDLQWTDEDGMKALVEVLRSPDAPPLLFVGTVRATAGDAVHERIRALIPGDVTAIELTNLDDREAHELARQLLRRAGASSVDSQRIATDAAGHPLFVEELARHAALGAIVSGETRLDDAIWARVAQLQTAARDIAELVAVAGKPVPQQVAAAATHLEPSMFQRSAAVLRASNLVRTSGARWEDAIEPYHDRIREAVLARLIPARRVALHEALAIAFEASSSSDPETLAVHWLEAGNAARAAAYAEAAGDQASETYAFERAAAWFEQALELLPLTHASRRSVRIKLGDALALAGRGALAAPHFELAAAESSAIDAINLRRRAAEQLIRSGHFDRGMEATRSVLGSIGMRIPSSRLQTIIWYLFYGLLLRVRGVKFKERSSDQITAIERTRMDACWSVGLSLSFVDSFVGFVFVRRALLLALSAGDLGSVVRALALVVSSASAMGSSRKRTQRLIGYTQELAARSDAVEVRGFGSAVVGTSAFLIGRFSEAEKNLRQSLEIFEDRATGLVYERVTIRMFLIWSLNNVGRFRDLARYRMEGLRDARARGDVYAEVNFTIGLSSIARLVEDRPDLVESETLAVMQLWTMRSFHLEHYYALLGLLCAKLYVSDAGAAGALAEEFDQRARSSLLWRIRTVRIRAQYAHGLATLAMIDAGKGNRAKHLASAARDARGLWRENLPWARSLANVLRAGLALQAGRREQCLLLLQSVADEFTAQHLDAYAAAARARIAQLRNDAMSAADIARAHTSLANEGVAAPERLIKTLVPSFASRRACC